MLTLSPAIRQHVKFDTTKRYARCLRVSRRDGAVFRWTDHDTPIALRTGSSPVVLETFLPDYAPSSESRRETVNMDANTTSLLGFIDSAAVTIEDLRIGLWRGATFEVFSCDWRYPFAGKIELRKYWLQDVKWTGSFCELQLATVTKMLDVRIGRIFNRECDAELGDDRCKKDLTGFSSGTRVVTDVLGITAPHPRLRFESTNTVQDDDFWKFGKLAWLTGNNAITGLNEYNVKLSKKVAGELELWTNTPYDIEVGDTFVVIAGCLKRLIEDCKNKFANEQEHRGWAYMINPDAVMKTPAAKGG